MSHKTINAALSVHLKSLGYPVEFENKNFDPTKGDAYLSEAYLPATTALPSIDKKGTRDYQGIYQVTVYAARDKGKAEAYTISEQVAKLFEPLTRITRDGITVEINDEPQQIGAFPVGDRFAIPVSVNWRALIKP